MERYLGLDVHAASCTLAVISQTGKRLKDPPVETNGLGDRLHAPGTRARNACQERVPPTRPLTVRM